MSSPAKINAMIETTKSIRSSKQSHRIDYSSGLGASISISGNMASVQLHTKPGTKEEELLNILIDSGIGFVDNFESPQKNIEPFRTVTFFLNGVEFTMFGSLQNKNLDVLDNQLELF